ncbi:MAG TPA: NAD(P)-dependent oxidoreductase [Ferruginibacter sp.]|nr:NAD(P)-dependent oxidoreductase [Ferruginibacter sp.]HRE65132.1 NAD(P)-dependent oxidoreductase [Ferruginibacter sp.]
MITIGLIREGKVPSDNRVALTPAQCRWMHMNRPDVKIIVQTSTGRCFSDAEYVSAGVEVKENIAEADILLGIKEVPVEMLIEGKTYLFFSHTKKLQPYNQNMLQEIIRKKITLIDYECLEHEDGARIIGFGFFAGIVGAHNGMMAYGNKTGAYNLDRVGAASTFQRLIHTYFGLKLPNINIAVTGSGRVAHGLLEIMNLLGIHEVEPDDYLKRDFTYPVYVHLKGADLYAPKDGGKYNREHFHNHPQLYNNLFRNYLSHTDILMNGVYWEEGIPRLFEWDDLKEPTFRIKTIADVTDDKNGSVPCNLGDSTIADPVYGVDKNSFEKTEPYLPHTVDIMAVGNLPNELPKDASRYFGEQLIKYILNDLIQGNSAVIDKATIVKEGKLTKAYDYMQAYAEGISK